MLLFHPLSIKICYWIKKAGIGIENKTESLRIEIIAFLFQSIATFIVLKNVLDEVKPLASKFTEAKP